MLFSYSIGVFFTNQSYRTATIEGNGRVTPAEVTLVQRMFLSARSRSESCELLGRAVTTGIQ